MIMIIIILIILNSSIILIVIVNFNYPVLGLMCSYVCRTTLYFEAMFVSHRKVSSAK